MRRLLAIVGGLILLVSVAVLGARLLRSDFLPAAVSVEQVSVRKPVSRHGSASSQAEQFANNSRSATWSNSKAKEQSDVSLEEMQAVMEVRWQPDGLFEMKELAATGNAYAASTVGDMLLACSARAREIDRYYLDRGQRQAAKAKSRLLGTAGSDPAPAASADSLVAIVTHAEAMQRQRQSMEERCNQPDYKQSWSGFDWFERAIAMGYEQARYSYIRQVVWLFGPPKSVSRYPKQAIALRNQALIYLAQIKAECSPESLQFYASYSTPLVDLSLEDRYVMTFAWLQLNASGADDRPRAEWGLAQIDALERLIAPAQKRRAKQRIQALLDRCGGS